MDEPSLQAAARTVLWMLERTAFIIAEPVVDDGPPNGEGLVARITFKGPRDGWLGLAAPLDFAELLAANLLGVEPDDPNAAARRSGAVGELLNIIAGALMAEFFGERVVVRLGIPEVAQSDAPVVPGAAADRLTLLTEENHRLELSLFLAD